MSDLEIGTTLDGLYRLDRLLGVGGVGSVYAAWHLNLGRPVAVKVLHPQFAQHQEPLQRFLREAQLLSKLGHESFVTVYDFSYSPDGMPYLVMELVEGENLRARLSRTAMTLDETLALFRPLCEALGKAHQQHILHRDLKPDNLMLTPTGMVRILDFGMAKLMSDEIPLTLDKVVMGTPYYMAPERARGSRVVEPASDVFSLGAILYEVLTRRMAFGAETPLAAMYKVIRAPVAPLNLPDAALSQRLDAVIAKACAKDPRQRYQTAPEMWAALDAAASGNMPSPSPTRESFHPTAGTRTTSSRSASVTANDDQTQIKAGIVHAIFGYVTTRHGDAGIKLLSDELGGERTARLLGTLPNSWVAVSDMQDLHLAIQKLFDDGSLEEMRNLGRHFAELSLTTIYKAFLVPGSPEVLVRRAQMMFSALSSAGEMQIIQTADNGWCMRILGQRTLTPAEVATNSGYVQRYLEMAGAKDVKLEERYYLQDAEPVGEIGFSFHLDS